MTTTSTTTGFEKTDRIILLAQNAEKRLARIARRPGLTWTPDAIHAATSLVESCVHFLTNDTGFGRVPSLSVVLLKECL